MSNFSLVWCPIFKNKYIWLILFSLFCVTNIFSQDHPKIASVQLEFDVEGKYESTIKSIITNRFREIPDIAIVDQDAAYRFIIRGLEIKTRSSEAIGIILVPLVLNPINTLPKKYLENNELYNIFLKDRSVYENSSIILVPYGELKQLCEEIVNKFDTDYMESLRRLRRLKH